jgi:Sulfotransferase domain
MKDVVFIASYPRSGNTWVRLLVGDVLLQMNGMPTDTELAIDIKQLIPDMHQHGDKWEGLAMPAQIESPYTILKTHFRWDQFQTRAAYIFRRPEDSLVSYFHYHRRYDHLRPKTVSGIDAFCREFVDEWCLHTQSFIKAHRNDPGRIHFTSYESLIAQTGPALGRMVRYLRLEPTHAQIATAVENHRFEKQQEAETSIPYNERFFRKGKVDTAKDELAPETLSYVRAKADHLYILCENLEQSQIRLD